MHSCKIPLNLLWCTSWFDSQASFSPSRASLDISRDSYTLLLSKTSRGWAVRFGYLLVCRQGRTWWSTNQVILKSVKYWSKPVIDLIQATYTAFWFKNIYSKIYFRSMLSLHASLQSLQIDFASLKSFMYSKECVRCFLFFPFLQARNIKREQLGSASLQPSSWSFFSPLEVYLQQGAQELSVVYCSGLCWEPGKNSCCSPASPSGCP